MQQRHRTSDEAHAAAIESSFLTREQVARELTRRGIRAGTTTLEYLARKDGGPRFSIILGRALYRRSDLEAWIAAQVSDGESAGN